VFPKSKSRYRPSQRKAHEDEYFFNQMSRFIPDVI
jgi:hypothetical protein